MSETALRTALEEALRAINSMKVEAETAGAGGDEQMLQEACEVISNEGLAASMAIDAALALAAPAQAAPGVQSDAAPCHCTNPWAHDQCTDSPGCKIKKKLTKASQPVAVPAGMEPVARIEGIDEYGPRLEWTQHWVDVGVGAKLYTATQVRTMLAAAQPVAVVASKLGDICSFRSSVARKGDVVYFQPPAQAQDARQPLNDEALDLMCEQALFGRISMQQFARSIESVHGIR